MRQILLHASAMSTLVVFVVIGVLWIVLYGRCGRFEAEETFVYTRKASLTVLSCAAAPVPCLCYAWLLHVAVHWNGVPVSCAN